MAADTVRSACPACRKFVALYPPNPQLVPPRTAWTYRPHTDQDGEPCPYVGFAASAPPPD